MGMSEQDMLKQQMAEAQRARSAMRATFDEDRLADSLAEGHAQHSPEEIERRAQEEARKAELKAQGEARLAELPGEISMTETRLEELQANLVKAQADAEKPGAMQKILASIAEEIKKDIAANQVSLDELTAERDFYLLQFGGDETTKQ